MSQSRVKHQPQPPRPEPVCSASNTVVTALATAEDVDPTELDVTLYDAIDPDALDSLFDNSLGDGIVVEFSIGDYTVTVRGSDHVLVSPAE